MSVSRSPVDSADKRDKTEEESQGKRSPGSPGRYSLSTEGSTEMAAVRIDSTRFPAVKAPESSGSVATAAAPSAKDSEPKPRPATLPHGMAAVAGPLSSRPGSSPSLLDAPPPPSRGINAIAPSSPPDRAATSLSSAPVSSEPPTQLAALPLVGVPTPPPPVPAPPKRGSGTAPRALPTPAPSLEDRINASARISSLRPPPPPRRDSRPPPSGGNTFEGFDEGSIAFAFDALLSENTSGLAGRDAVDLTPVRELFAELAANHMRHVRDFMIDVKWGEAPREWIEICIPAVVSLRRAADRLELVELALGLDRFGVQLETARQDPARSIEGETKEKLLDEYAQLVAMLPAAFALDRDKSRREAVIIQSLCLSVPDVRKVTIDKLHAAGLTSLKTLFDAKADEVAQVAGIPESLAMRIVERFQAYRCELQNASPQDARAAERERLATLTTQLLAQHDGYEDASKGWSPDAKAKKRDLFRGREETWLAISLLLARFGEVERLQGIEKVPFAQRIAQLTEYLEEARDRYRSE